jgi:5-methyltetrahydrofolate--homocysteine methyltransferase
MDRETQQTYYLQDPEEMAAGLEDLNGAGAWLIGGCCGTSPDHIRSFRTQLSHLQS